MRLRTGRCRGSLNPDRTAQYGGRRPGRGAQWLLYVYQDSGDGGLSFRSAYSIRGSERLCYGMLGVLRYILRSVGEQAHPDGEGICQCPLCRELQPG